MTRSLIRCTLLLLLGVVLATFGETTLIARAAQPARPSAVKTAAFSPAMDYDMAIVDPAVLVEGYLHTDADPKNSANGIGSFVDNFAGSKTYPASYNGTSGQTTINTGLGKFVFDSTASAISYPTRLGPGQAFGVDAVPHVYYPQSYHLYATAAASYGLPFSGTLTWTYDNYQAGFIVSDNKKASRVNHLVGTIGPKAFVAPIIQMAGFEYLGITDNTYLLFFKAKINGLTYYFQSFERPAPSTYSGVAYSDGLTKKGVLYTWNLEP